MFGVDLRSPTEATYLSPSVVQPSTVEDYKEKIMLSLSSARELAVKAIKKSQNHYKHQYDRKLYRQTIVLVTGYSLGFLQLRVEKTTSYRSLGKDHIISYRELIQILRHQRFISQMIARFRYTNKGLLGVHLS